MSIKKNNKKFKVIISIILSVVILITSAFYIYSKQNLNEKSKELTRKEAIKQYFSFDWYEQLSDEMYDYIMYLGEKGYHCESVMDDGEHLESDYTYDIKCVDELGNSSARDYESVVFNGVEYDMFYSIYITGKEADKYYISPKLYVEMEVDNPNPEYDVLRQDDQKIEMSYSHYYTKYEDRSKEIIENNYYVSYGLVCSMEYNNDDYIYDVMTNQYTVDENSGFKYYLADENIISKDQSIKLCNQLIDEGYTNQMYNDVIKDIESDFDEIIAEGERLLN